MNLSSMEYFVALARERSFTRAAERLHITQQSLSAHVAALEKELGCQLILRRVPLELTYAGEVFLGYAASFQRQLTALHQEFGDIAGNVETLLALCVEGVGNCFCPENLARASLTQAQLDRLRILRLGDAGHYMIRFGYLEGSYQWSIISEFMETAKGL